MGLPVFRYHQGSVLDPPPPSPRVPMKQQTPSRKRPSPSAAAAPVPARRAVRGPLVLAAVLLAAAALWVRREPLEIWRASRGSLSTLEQYVQAHPGSGDAQRALAESYLRAGRPADAAALLSRLVDRDPADASLRVQLARSLVEAGNPGDAYAHLQVAVTALKSDDPEAHWWLGQVLERRHNPDAAAAEYERAARLRPGDPRPLFRLAELARAEDRLTAAEGYYRRAHAARADDVPTLTSLAEVLFRLGRATEALPFARRAAQLAPADPRAQLWLARSLQAADPDHSAEAEAAYRKAMSGPEAATARFHLALMLRDLGRTAEAADLLEADVRENPLHHVAYYELAACARKLGQRERAERATRRFEQLQQAEARTGALEAQLSVDPENKALRLRLAALYVRFGRPDLARPQVDRVLAKTPQDPEARRLAAQIAAHPNPSL